MLEGCGNAGCHRFVIAARKMGYRVTVLDPDADSPAGSLADRHIAAAYEDPQALDELARSCAAATTEFENVPAQSLERLAQSIRVANLRWGRLVDALLLIFIILLFGIRPTPRRTLFSSRCLNL